MYRFSSGSGGVNQDDGDALWGDEVDLRFFREWDWDACWCLCYVDALWEVRMKRRFRRIVRGGETCDNQRVH